MNEERSINLVAIALLLIAVLLSVGGFLYYQISDVSSIEGHYIDTYDNDIPYYILNQTDQNNYCVIDNYSDYSFCFSGNSEDCESITNDITEEFFEENSLLAIRLDAPERVSELLLNNHHLKVYTTRTEKRSAWDTPSEHIYLAKINAKNIEIVTKENADKSPFCLIKKAVSNGILLLIFFLIITLFIFIIRMEKAKSIEDSYQKQMAKNKALTQLALGVYASFVALFLIEYAAAELFNKYFDNLFIE